MRSTGIRRKVDDLGRVVIPAGIRHSLGIKEGDALEVGVDGDLVILAPPTDRCVFCGTSEGAVETFHGKTVCHTCVSSLGVLDRQLRPAADPMPAAPTPTEPAVGNDRTPAPDERAAGVRDERRSRYDPASTTAW